MCSHHGRSRLRGERTQQRDQGAVTAVARHHARVTEETAQLESLDRRVTKNGGEAFGGESEDRFEGQIRQIVPRGNELYALERSTGQLRWQRHFAHSPVAGGAAVGELSGRIIALDLLEFEAIEGVHFIQGDFREEVVLRQLEDVLAGDPVDVVISDMAPNLSGIEITDAARIEHLIELALDFSQNHLKPQGALVAKVFHGSGYSQLVQLFKDQFRVVKAIKPKSSRDKSSETFLLGIGLKKPR